MRQMMGDAHAELLRAVRRTLEADQRLARTGSSPPFTITSLSSEPWFSATFSGERHAIGLRLRGAPQSVASARDWLAVRLPAAEFELRGHLVASVAVIACESEDPGSCELRLEALTIVED